jgi:hypothetical protein
VDGEGIPIVKIIDIITTTASVVVVVAKGGGVDDDNGADEVAQQHTFTKQGGEREQRAEMMAI